MSLASPEPTSESNPDHFEVTPSFDQFELLESTKQVYLDACRKYAAIPTRRNRRDVKTIVSQYTDAFASTMEIFAEEVPALEFCTILPTILSEHDSTRVDCLNGILGREALAKLIFKVNLPDETTITENGEGIMKEVGKASIGQMFISGIQNDTDQFLFEVGSSKNAKIIELGRMAGKHSLDVAKIAAGVAIALAFSNRKRS